MKIVRDTDRRTAFTTGVLFIIATAASLLGTAIEQPVAAGAGYVAQIAANVDRVTIGGLLELVAAGTSAGIAISLYSVLRRWSEGLALGAVVFRAIEAVMYGMAALSLISLLKIGQQFAQAVSVLRQEAILVGVFAFVVGALMYYVVFYRSQLIPRWLAGWGIVAELLMLVACLSALFSGNPVTSYTMLVLPIAVQEMVLAIWLIARGFNPAAARTKSSARVVAA